ncbi:MAG: TlpA family protein disulfide reductase [Candidatus Rokubacteria bacterium]|nr:TlpA family protein disulfide reductase [Candidatus Rokubacteria bacterium]
MERFTPPRRAKPFALPTLEGKTVRLADFRGKVVFVNFRATWCPACREEWEVAEAIPPGG